MCSVRKLILGLLTSVSLSVWAAPPDPIAQTLVGEASYDNFARKRRDVIRVGSVTVVPADTDDEAVISGQDKRGRPWKVYLKTGNGISYSAVWTANLDGDDIPDWIIFHNETRNEQCLHGSRLTTILFDAEGRPSPWESEGNFNVDYIWNTKSGSGVLDLGDWNNNGRAEMVQTACYGYLPQDPTHEPYGMAGVYEAREGVWRRLSSAEAAPQDATYRAVANSGFRNLVPESEQKKEFLPDLSNDRAKGRSGNIAALVPPRAADAACGEYRDLTVKNGRLVEKSPEEKTQTRQQCDEHLALKDGTACFSSGKPSIVITAPNSTEAAMYWESQRAQSFLQEIIAEKLPVTLTGQFEEGVCSPTMIWARKP